MINGSGEYILLFSFSQSVKESTTTRTITIPSTYTGKGVFVLLQDDKQLSGYIFGITINTTGYTTIFSRQASAVDTKLVWYPNLTGGNSVSYTKASYDDYAHILSAYAFAVK